MSLTLTDVRKVYDGRSAVDGVTADIPAGSFFVALGPSGCGKSTLLRLIAGLETLDGGAIALDGQLVAGPGLHVAPEARRVGVVFQSYALWPHMSVARNVAFPIEATGTAKRAALAEARQHLAAVSLESFADRRPAELSGGQRQRVALARCLASRARTVLMDEPLANLDPHLRQTMEEELASFHRRAGVTTLYITHDQREAMALADLVAVMREGRFAQVAPPETVYARPADAHVARFIGRSAVLPVTVERMEGGRAVAVAGDQRLTLLCGEGGATGDGQAVIRPEDVEADPDGRPATVRSVSYRGGMWEAALDVGLAEPVPFASRRRLDEGETVPISLTGGWLLPG
jgi:iron(III) transport system ATP-binding protein